MGEGKYRGLHQWVESQLGKPMECSACGSNNRSRYVWSNVSGDYHKDLNDRQRLCQPCHVAFDGSALNRVKTHCINGHELVDPNLYITPSTGSRSCLTCKRNLAREYGRARRKRLKMVNSNHG
jgi:hypothetical protein